MDKEQLRVDSCPLSTVHSPLKDGYKQTEVGVIPEEWDAKALGSHVDITSGESPSLFRFERDGIPYFKVDQLNNDTKYLSATPYYFRTGKTVPQGSLIFPKRGASILLNKVRILERDSFMDTNLMTLTPKGSLDNEYLYYALTHIQLWRIADTTSIPQINNKHIIPLVVLLPPLPEQRAIAAALSDVDALIGALDQLIAKKRDLKQAAMQQLLTGQTRLPGFSGEWVVKRIADLAFLSKSGVNPGSNPNALFTHFSLPAFDAGAVPVVERGGLIGSNKFVVPPSAVLLSKLNPRIPRIWAPSHIPTNAVCSTEFLVLVPREGTDRAFLTAVCRSPTVSYQMELHAIGTTGSHQRINPSQALTIEVSTPRDEAEQTAIATVLFDMDAEITALEQRRDKTRALKQGMMQELLTGKTRLV